MFGELILRIQLVQLAHDPVPSHLGNDRRRGDAGHNLIALPDCQPWGAQPIHAEPIGDHVCGGDFQARQGHPQGHDIGDMHAQRIAFAGLDAHHRPSDRLLGNFAVQALPLQRREQLGVPQSGDLS